MAADEVHRDLFGVGKCRQSARRGDQLAESEWITCSTNSEAIYEENYLGTSEGWIFRLNQDEEWTKMEPDVTSSSGMGIRDMWLDSNNNLYFVTDNGYLIFQTYDYDFSAGEGERRSFPVTHGGLTSIWGADPEHLFMVGYTENIIIQASLNTDTYELDITEVDISSEFPDKGGQSIGLLEDQFGLPRR